ncbi:hypothetical protein D3C72_1608040 [compost metagenome]
MALAEPNGLCQEGRGVTRRRSCSPVSPFRLSTPPGPPAAVVPVCAASCSKHRSAPLSASRGQYRGAPSRSRSSRVEAVMASARSLAYSNCDVASSSSTPNGSNSSTWVELWDSTSSRRSLRCRANAVCRCGISLRISASSPAS